MQAANADLKLIYEGSVKRVYAPATDPHHLWFQFTDDYSVFDWGKMPDTIANKGLSLALLGAYFFEQLERKGVPGHFAGLVDSRAKRLEFADAVSARDVYMQVRRADVHRPQCINVRGQNIYCYPRIPENSHTRLVPLEVVFRFGMPAGSSLKERLQKNPEYASQLGLSTLPAEGAWFDQPVLEFFTKLEPKDRLLSLTEAAAISGLTGEQFQQLIELALRCADELSRLFKARGIELWDGKFEFILAGDQLLLADSIGPDELRLIYRGVHLSKELIRQVYRGSAWEKSLAQAQKLAAARGVEDWVTICSDELNQRPEQLPASFKRNVDQLYGVLVNHMCEQQLIPNQVDLDSLVNSLSR